MVFTYILRKFSQIKIHHGVEAPGNADYDTMWVEFIGFLSRVSGRMTSLDNR
jgi:hypothetical protein